MSFMHSTDSVGSLDQLAVAVNQAVLSVLLSKSLSMTQLRAREP